MITRDEILARARAVPQRSDLYSQDHLDGDGTNAAYRPDCSGWVSYCWGCPTSGPGTWGGYSTTTLLSALWAPGVTGIMYEIPRSELQPGDAIGHCGPNTGGNGGHIALWLGKAGDQEHILDMGGGWGPLDHTATWGVGTGWNAAGNIRAFRFRGVVDHPGAFDQAGDIMFCKKGDLGPVVEALQRLGLAAGGALPRFGPDGSYGDETAAMLRALGVCGGDATGNTYGPSEYAGLMAKLATRGPKGDKGDAGIPGTPGPAGPPGPGVPVGAKLVVTVVEEL